MRELKGSWKDLFRLFRVSLHIPKLLLGACGLLASLVTVGILTFFMGVKASNIGPVQEYLQQQYVVGALPDHVTELVYSSLALPCVAMQDLLAHGSFLDQFLWALGSGMILIIIWSFFGTAISRISALEITRDERIEMSEALAYTSDKFGASFMSFLLPVIGFAFFWIVVWIVALLANLPVVNIIVMLGLPLALLGGFIMVLIMVGTGGGFPLFIPSISVEGTDSFDAISRGFSYVLSRVWYYLWNWGIAIVYGVICTAFVLVFAKLMQWTVNNAGLMAISDQWFPFQRVIDLQLGGETTLVKAAAVIYYFWILIFQLLAFGFGVSYFFSSSTLIYLLMRKRVDGIDMEEVYEELDEEEELIFDEESFEEDEDFGDETSEDESDEETEDEEEEEQEEWECTEPDCDRTFDSEFGRDQHHRMMHEDDD